MKIRKYNVAIVGATGLVGNKLFKLLMKRSFPINQLKLLASERSVGKKLVYGEKHFLVEQLTRNSFKNIDLVFFTAGGKISKEYAAKAVEAGAIVVDNTSAYRMQEDIPLVVPEVNGFSLKGNKGIISNPNCSTIQLVLALSPLKKSFGLERVVISTYQSISGAGSQAIKSFKNQVLSLVENDFKSKVSEDERHPFAFNLIPQIDEFESNGFTREEIKMMEETKKILGDKEIKIAATCVRVPVLISHSESVYVEVGDKDISKEDFARVLSSQPSVKILDHPAKGIYPTPEIAKNQEKVFIGRIRRDRDVKNGFHLWIVSDNLLKGAALNSIQIAEALIERKIM